MHTLSWSYFEVQSARAYSSVSRSTYCDCAHRCGVEMQLALGSRASVLATL
jgi:hypothetical protein